MNITKTNKNKKLFKKPKTVDINCNSKKVKIEIKNLVNITKLKKAKQDNEKVKIKNKRLKCLKMLKETKSIQFDFNNFQI